MTTKRIYEVWIGQQASGKTYALRSRIKVLSEARSVSSVWVLDTTGELLDTGEQIGRWTDYLAITSETLPPVVVFRDALAWVTWPDLYSEAAAQGNVCLVLDEAYVWFPFSPAPVDDARKILLQGRHLVALDGKEHPLHIVMAAQYPRTLHHLAWDQAATVLCGVVGGELTEKWISQNFGRPELARVKALRIHEWTAIRGERPRAPGVLWRG